MHSLQSCYNFIVDNQWELEKFPFFSISKDGNKMRNAWFLENNIAENDAIPRVFTALENLSWTPPRT